MQKRQNQNDEALRQDLANLFKKLELTELPFSHYLAIVAKSMITDTAYKSMDGCMTTAAYQEIIHYNQRILELLTDLDRLQQDHEISVR